MNEILKVKFLFKSKPFSVSLQQKDYQNLPQPVLLSLLIQQQYEIKSDVKEEIFQSIIEYFVHETVPDIQKENIDEYDLISKELQLQNISEIIQQKRDFFNNISKIISSISDKSVTDNSSQEHSISKVLDDVIEYYSDELMNLPIQSLYNIFSSDDCNFTSHERLYDLILNHFENNKDYEICMLLQFIDGSKIPEQKLINSIDDESLHFGFKPFFGISSLFKKIHELENEKGKQNNKPGKKRNEEQNDNSNNEKDEEQNDNSNDKKDDEQNDNSNDKKDEEQNDNSNDKKDEEQNDSSNDKKDDEQNDNSNNKKDDEQNDNSNDKKDDEQNDNSNDKKDDEQNDNSYSSKEPNPNAVKIDETCAYINEKNEIYDEGKFYKLDHVHHTAEVSFVESAIYDIYVPPSIVFKSIEYVITKIGKNDEPLEYSNSITFSNDSRIKCIDFSNIQASKKIFVSIPSQLEKIFFSRFYDVDITIPPNCQNFKWSENFILGKSNVNSDKFDTIVKARSYIKQVIIPSDIEHINQSCFYNCKSLQQIEFLPDSKITSIGKDLFNCNNITIVNLPNSLILKGNTSFIQHLKDIVITPNNQNFKCFENIFLGKSNVNSDEFDTLACAFRNVVSANIPSNIKHICPLCFNNCSTLQNVVFSNDSQLRSIEAFAFAKTSIETITIPPHVTEIGYGAFIECSKLRNVVFSNNSELRSIGYYAFFNTLISSITIPPHVTEIGDYAFNRCSKLQYINFSNDSELRSIGYSAFSQTSIETITIPPHVTEIGYCAFRECSKLRNVVFSNNSELRSIGYEAFFGTSIETITIPPHVTVIDSEVFNYCSKLRNASFPNNSELRTTGRIATNNQIQITLYSETDGKILFDASKNASQVIIPSNIKNICSDFFINAQNLNSVVIPNNSEIRSIGQYAFSNTSISSITIPSHVTEIGDYAFSRCSRLKNINFSNDSELRLIGRYAFIYSSIETITIPPHVTEISDGAFKSCSKLQNIVISYNSELRSIGRFALECENVKNIRIPPHLTMYGEGNLNNAHCNYEICGISTIFSIGRNIVGSGSTFQIFPSPDDGCYKWIDESILLGKSNENEDDYDILVYANPFIEQVTIPSSIKYIYNRCFDNCRELKHVEFLPDSKLISIGEYAFGSTSIEKITIPSHVTEINEGAFFNCSKLLIVFYPDDSELQSIGNCAFYNTYIDTIVIPRNVSTIGKSAFGGCHQIKNILFSKGSKLNLIEQSAFEKLPDNSISNYYIRSKNKIMVPSKNQRLKLCEDCTLLGKSDENLDDFDTILIGNKYDYDSKVTIPANIKYIYPYSFSGARIKEIEILPNSKLLCIGDNAFNIASFTFPKNIIKIGRGLNIQKVIFECGSKLSLFRYMSLCEGSVTILSDLRPYIIALLKKCNRYSERLINFIVPSENKRYKSLGNLILYKSKEDSDDFDVLLSASNTSSLKIPSTIKYIFPYCFFKCNLQNIEFPEDSQLLSIGEHAFEEIPIETIKIPPHVTEIGEYAFKFCKKLRNVVFPNNSELRSIGREAFYLTSITSITIPQHVTEIGDAAFCNTSQKIDVVFPKNSELR